MIPRESRLKIWYLIRKVAHKKGIPNIAEETKRDYWEYMKQPEENIRYILIEAYNLDTGFFYKAIEENELKGTEEQKMKYMFEKYFQEDNSWEDLLLIDVKNIKAYTLTKEIKYKKRLIK